jgi:glycerol dehydrogenase-like iron-containing ADH family enzyme
MTDSPFKTASTPDEITPEIAAISPSSPLMTLTIAPAQVMRGAGILTEAAAAIARLGQRPLIVWGEITRHSQIPAHLLPALQTLQVATASYGKDCSEPALTQLTAAATAHSADVILGVGGGKALDMAKLLANHCQLPIATLPTSAATCAAWTALSNVYSESHAFLYDVGIPRCPDLLILDYDLVQLAPQRTLVAGIGDAIAKWYEASVSSGQSHQTMVIGAVQQARVLRDLLLQNAGTAIANPGSPIWREVVDATVLMAGVIGGMGGAQCRTVAAHAVHNGLTQLPQSHSALHGEKVAYGILVQLRLEELLQGNQLAVTARQQLLKFYSEIDLPQTLFDLGLQTATLADLQQAAEFACRPSSDLHHLPFAVTPTDLLAAMISTTAAIPA